MKERIHKKILEKSDELLAWYQAKLKDAYVPFNASFDIRDAGFKIGNVDGNIFPAGFNNICSADKESAPELAQEFLNKQFPETKKILVLAEDHLKNLYYWENVIAMCSILTEAGYEVKAGMLSSDLEGSVEITSFMGNPITVHRIRSEAGQLMTKDFKPDLVISNNDFSNAYEEIDFSRTVMTPLKDLGWFQRKKNCYFTYYNECVEEFAKLIGEDPWLFSVKTELFEDFDIKSDESREALALRVEAMLTETAAKYKEHGIEETPYAFIKNNAGTYGLGVVEASSGDDVRAWNYKTKKKMKAAKGGREISEVIIQEGVPSSLMEGTATAEPALYMLGEELVGGFLRTHEKKDAKQSLNSPGAVYKRLCLSDLKVSAEGCVLENVYGWIAKIGLLAISKEAAVLKDRSLSSC